MEQNIYATNREKENKTLKDFMGQITDAVSFKGDNPDRTDKDILNDVIYILRWYNEVFKEENENDWSREEWEDQGCWGTDG